MRQTNFLILKIPANVKRVIGCEAPSRAVHSFEQLTVPPTDIGVLNGLCNSVLKNFHSPGFRGLRCDITKRLLRDYDDY